MRIAPRPEGWLPVSAERARVMGTYHVPIVWDRAYYAPSWAPRVLEEWHDAISLGCGAAGITGDLALRNIVSHVIASGDDGFADAATTVMRLRGVIAADRMAFDAKVAFQCDLHRRMRKSSRTG